MGQNAKANFLRMAIGFVAGIAIVLAFFYVRGDLKSWSLNGDQGRLWEIVLKAVAGLLALSGAIVAVLKYLDDKAAAAKAEEKENVKDLVAMRQDIYMRLIKSMAKLINRDPGHHDWLPIQDTFFEIYWGELRWVWNSEVELAARAYAKALFEYMGGPKNELISLGEDVVRACRKSLGEAWDVERDLIPSQPLKAKHIPMKSRANWRII